MAYCCCFFNGQTCSQIAIQFGTGQEVALHWRAWIGRRAQIRLHTLQPPVACCWHCAPCMLQKPLPLGTYSLLAEGHFGEGHIRCCVKKQCYTMQCSWILLWRSFCWASVSSVCWPDATGISFRWWECMSGSGWDFARTLGIEWEYSIIISWHDRLRRRHNHTVDLSRRWCANHLVWKQECQEGGV
jgi:hypothetical protein